MSPELLGLSSSKSVDTPEGISIPPAVPVRKSPKIGHKIEDKNVIPPTLPPKKKHSDQVDYFEVPVSSSTVDQEIYDLDYLVHIFIAIIIK